MKQHALYAAMAAMVMASAPAMAQTRDSRDSTQLPSNVGTRGDSRDIRPDGAMMPAHPADARDMDADRYSTNRNNRDINDRNDARSSTSRETTERLYDRSGR